MNFSEDFSTKVGYESLKEVAEFIFVHGTASHSPK